MSSAAAPTPPERAALILPSLREIDETLMAAARELYMPHDREAARERLHGLVVSVNSIIRADAERITTLEDDASSSWECLEMIRETLASMIPMAGCPPMFYNDAVRALAFRSAAAGMRAIARGRALQLSDREVEALMPLAGRLLRQGLKNGAPDAG